VILKLDRIMLSTHKLIRRTKT